MTKSKIDRDSKGKFIKGNKASLKSGTEIFLRTGKLPKQIRGATKLKRDLSRIRAELELELGSVNVKEELLIDQVISSTGFLRLFELFVKRAGLLDPVLARKKQIAFQPGFSVYLQFMHRQTEALKALPLNKDQQEKVLSPLQLAEMIDNEKAQSSEASTIQKSNKGS